MVFVNLTPGQVNGYSYACGKLQHTLNKMSAARQTLQHAADASIDSSFAKCVYLFTSELLQFENEIHLQIYSFNCLPVAFNEARVQPKKSRSFSPKNIESLCRYLEVTYINSYRRVLKDKHLDNDVKKSYELPVAGAAFKLNATPII